MKRKPMTRLLIGLLMVLPSLWVGCTKNDDGSFVEPITVYEKVDGTWNMLSLKMIDETAKAASIKPDEVVLTDQFGFAGFSISLNVDASNKPTNFTVSGTAPALLPTQGFWNLDKSFPAANGKPVVVNFYSDEAKTQLTNQVSITSMPGGSAEMELKLVHTSNGVAYVSYLYRLVLATTTK